VSRVRLAFATLLAAACSTIGEDGASVAVEFLVPSPPVVEIDDTIQLRARVLDQNGDSIAATIRWRTPDVTVGVDSVTGRFWGDSGTSGRVQPSSGTLVGSLAIFAVRTRTDSVIIEPAADTLLVAVADSVSAPLAPIAAPALAGRALTFTIVAPSPAAARLNGDVVSKSTTTASDGRPATPVRVRRAGLVAGDTVTVQVDSHRPSGALVPGSGQVIRVVFQ
jgi:hypothetical protein